MVSPKLPSSPTKRKRRRRKQQFQVDNRVLLIPLGLAGLSIAWNIVRLCRSLLRSTGNHTALRRDHPATMSSWNYDWCQPNLNSDLHCAFMLPIDLEDFLPPLPDEPFTEMIPDPVDLLKAAFDDDEGEEDHYDKSSNNNNTPSSVNDDLDNHLDRFGQLLMNPSMFLYPPTPRILVEARRNLTLTASYRYNKNITHQTPLEAITKGDHFALVSRRGLGGSHLNNQDRAILLDPFPLVFSQSQPHRERENPFHNNFFMSIFDGHGLSGHIKADHAAATLPRILQEQLKRFRTELYTDAQVRAALQASFWEVHRQGPPIHDSGCTASAILGIGQLNHLYFANTGDSRSMLVEIDTGQQQVNITHVTKQHKPNDPTERQRITKTGCIVIDPIPFHDPTARVAENPEGKVSSGLALAMSRSLGDYDLEHCGVIPEPTITAVALSQHIKQPYKVLLAVSATDGLFDRVTLEEIAHGLAGPFLNRNTYSEMFASALELAAEDLIRTASDRWLANTSMFPYRDDITLVVRQLR